VFIFKKKVPEGFERSTALPRSEVEAARWQGANRSWWESHPMRYDWGERIAFAPYSKEFFAEIDRRFFESTSDYMPWKEIPFDPLIDFRSLRDRDVLEIGVGSGSHAQLLATHARSFTGIDLTDSAVQTTTRRMRAYGLPAAILRMDAERMAFQNEQFDFIWSWGVIHHSANTRNIIEEMYRVLRPGGRAMIMVYHRSWWNYYVGAGLFEGILAGDLWRTRSLHKTMQNRWDGALARFYTTREWQALVGDLFSIDEARIYGQRSEIIPIDVAYLRYLTLPLIPRSVSRFLTNTCRLGSFLVTFMSRRT
jgi:2-polyprenyl-3-methyl-5-hydroxy-6-metoxy-1,4-benzoquinol methylase